MAERNYQAPDFRVPDTEQVAAPQVAGPGPNGNAPQHFGDSQWMSRMVGQLAGQAEGSLLQAADVARQNLYLKGQADVGMIQSEAEIQGNPLTKDWEVAGYRDTMGKLALADQQAQFMVDLPELRQRGPDEVQQYLDQRRQKFAPTLAGMSLQARASTAGQMLLQDKAAISTYTGEHTKFIIDQKSQAVQTAWGTSIASMKPAISQVALTGQGQEELNAQVQSTVGTLVGGVWMDHSLPIEVKRNLTSQAAQQALAEDNIPLFDYLNNHQIPDGTGGTSTLTSRLTGDQQMQVANAHREAYARTSSQRSLFRSAQMADVESQITNNAYTGTYAQLNAFLSQGVINGEWSGEKRESVLQSYNNSQYKFGAQAGLYQAAVKGDYSAILNTPGGSLDKAMEATDAVMAHNKVDPTTRLNTFLTIGSNGISQGYKKAGEQLGVTINQIANSTDGRVLPQHVQVFAAINSAVRAAEDKGDNTVRANLLSGMDEGTRVFASQIFSGTDAGKTLDESLQAARTSAAEDAKLSPSMRSARATKNVTAVNTAIDNIDSRGLFSSGWLHIKAAFGSTTAEQTLKLEPTNRMSDRDGFFSTSPTVQFYADASREAMRAEASQVMNERPGATPDQVIQVARANVAARTIDVEGQGPLIMPKNVNLQTTFGVAPNNQAAIGSAIGSMLKSTDPTARWQVSFANGQLYAQQVNTDDGRIGNGIFITGDQIKSTIATQMHAQTEAAKVIFGEGKIVNSHGTNVQYSGNNVAGAPHDWMLGFRDNLIQHEGIRNTAYTDTVGVTTNGVGIAKQNPHYPTPDVSGKITDKQASDSFNAASDDAAKAGLRVATTIGKYNQPTFLLMSELAYQSGGAFMGQDNSVGTQYRAFGQALAQGNAEAAQTAFKDTAAYRVSGEARRQHYLNLVAQAATMKGN